MLHANPPSRVIPTLKAERDSPLHDTVGVRISLVWTFAYRLPRMHGGEPLAPLRMIFEVTWLRVAVTGRRPSYGRFGTGGRQPSDLFPR